VSRPYSNASGNYFVVWRIDYDFSAIGNSHEQYKTIFVPYGGYFLGRMAGNDGN
jgi:hypothetical protein